MVNPKCRWIRTYVIEVIRDRLALKNDRVSQPVFHGILGNGVAVVVITVYCNNRECFPYVLCNSVKEGASCLQGTHASPQKVINAGRPWMKSCNSS